MPWITSDWRLVFKPGDFVVILIALLFVAWLTSVCWQGGVADRAVIRSEGKVVAELALSRNQEVSVSGPLGISVVRIENRAARIIEDPSPRQYCVQQGWLRQVGEVALCLPNRVSVELVSGTPVYDSLSY